MLSLLLKFSFIFQKKKKSADSNSEDDFVLASDDDQPKIPVRTTGRAKKPIKYDFDNDESE